MSRALSRPLPWQGQIAVLVASQFLAVIGFSFFNPFFALYLQELGIRDRPSAAAFAGLMFFANSMVLAALAPIWGAVADRFGPKVMTQRAMFGSGVLIALMAAARSPTELLIVFCALGGVSGVMASTTTLASALAPSAHVARAIGFSQAAWSSGAAIGPFVAGLLAGVLGYRNMFLVGTAFFIAAGLLITLFVQSGAVPSASQPGFISSFRFAVNDRRLLAISALVFLVQAGTTGMLPVIPVFVQELEPDPERVNVVVGIVFGLGGVTGAIGAVAAARFSDRFGAAGVLSVIAGLGAVFQLPHAIATNSIQLILARGLFGAVQGGYLPMTGAMTAQAVPPERRGIAYGMNGSAFALGNGIGPLLVGGVVVLAGIRPAFGIGAIVLIAAAAGARWFEGRLRRAPPLVRRLRT